MTARIDAIRAAVALLPNDKDRKLPAELEWRSQTLAHLAAAANTRPDVSRLADTPPDKLDALLDDYAHTHSRQATADWLLKSGAQNTLRTAYNRRLDEYLPPLLDKLAPVAADAIKALIQAAAALPAGPAALDAPAVLASGAGDAYAAATQAIATLETLAALHAPKVDPDLKIPTRDGHGIAALVALPDNVTPTRMGMFARKPIDPAQAAQNRAIAALPEAWRASHAHALLAVARGEHPGVSLDLAATSAEADARATALAVAGQTVAVDDRPDAPTLDREAADRETIRRGILTAGHQPPAA